MKQLKKYNLVLLLICMALPVMASAKKSDNEKTKEIYEEFEVNENSKVYFKHRRGTLRVKYIQGNKARVEATVTVKGDDLDDIQTLMDALTIDITEENGQLEIKTANKIVSWSSNSGLWGSKHKIVLSNGKVINTKVDDITIHATLLLPKVEQLSLNNRYDDIVIEGYKANKLGVDIHSATLRTGDLMSDTYVKIKYGKLDVQNVQDLNLDSHDSKGTVGNIGQLLLKDKYSDLKFGNLQSLEADLHDANIEFESIGGDANIKDKYSVIRIKDMYNGTWDLHDSKVIANNVFKIKVKTKYSDIILDKAISIEMDCHDDDLKVELIETLNLTKSKYTKISIGTLEKNLYAEDSHDDHIDIDASSSKFQGLKFNAKYSDLNLPLPAGMGYTIDANMKYGELNYPKKGLKEMRYIKDGSDLEVHAVAADGSKDVVVSIQGHDCKINLE